LLGLNAHHLVVYGSTASHNRRRIESLSVGFCRHISVDLSVARCVSNARASTSSIMNRPPLEPRSPPKATLRFAALTNGYRLGCALRFGWWIIQTSRLAGRALPIIWQSVLFPIKWADWRRVAWDMRAVH